MVGGRSVLSHRLYAWPFSVGHAFALDTRQAACRVILQTASGGLISRDTIHQRITVGEGTRVEVTGQGAMSVHGARDDRAGVEEAITLRVASGGLLHYRPEIRIVFPRAQLRQRTDAVVSPGGVLVFADAVVLHPSVDAGNFGMLVSSVRLTGADGLVMSEETQGFRSLPPLLETHRAFATVYLVSPQCPLFTERVLDALAGEVERIDHVYSSVTVLPGYTGVAVRMAAHNGEQLRRGLNGANEALREIAERIITAYTDTAEVADHTIPSNDVPTAVGNH